MLKKNKNTAIVALSGGLDSCVTVAIANQEYNLALVHFNYGQRTEQQELKAFNNIAAHYNVNKKMVIDLKYLSRIGGSSLTDEKIKVSKADLSSKRNLPAGRQVPTSYVPFRNANMLSACVSWAEVLGARFIFIGAVFEDSSGYPDCRPEFFKAFSKMTDLGTKPETEINIVTPVIRLSKAEIIKKGIELDAPLHLTWSCYKNEDKACGICDSCALRLRAFQQAEINDPIPYVKKPNYLNNYV